MFGVPNLQCFQLFFVAQSLRAAVDQFDLLKFLLKLIDLSLFLQQDFFKDFIFICEVVLFLVGADFTEF